MVNYKLFIFLLKIQLIILHDMILFKRCQNRYFISDKYIIEISEFNLIQLTIYFGFYYNVYITTIKYWICENDIKMYLTMKLI